MPTSRHLRMNAENAVFPCRCQADTHGDSYQAICHGLGIDTEGPFALIEKQDGTVIRFAIGSHWSLKLDNGNSVDTDFFWRIDKPITD